MSGVASTMRACSRDVVTPPTPIPSQPHEWRSIHHVRKFNERDPCSYASPMRGVASTMRAKFQKDYHPPHSTMCASAKNVIMSTTPPHNPQKYLLFGHWVAKPASNKQLPAAREKKTERRLQIPVNPSVIAVPAETHNKQPLLSVSYFPKCFSCLNWFGLKLTVSTTRSISQ